MLFHYRLCARGRREHGDQRSPPSTSNQRAVSRERGSYNSPAPQLLGHSSTVVDMIDDAGRVLREIDDTHRIDIAIGVASATVVGHQRNLAARCDVDIVRKDASRHIRCRTPPPEKKERSGLQSALRCID
jgi:hypothetical protein